MPQCTTKFRRVSPSFRAIFIIRNGNEESTFSSRGCDPKAAIRSVELESVMLLLPSRSSRNDWLCWTPNSKTFSVRTVKCNDKSCCYNNREDIPLAKWKLHEPQLMWFDSHATRVSVNQITSSISSIPNNAELDKIGSTIVIPKKRKKLVSEIIKPVDTWYRGQTWMKIVMQSIVHKSEIIVVLAYCKDWLLKNRTLPTTHLNCFVIIQCSDESGDLRVSDLTPCQL